MGQSKITATIRRRILRLRDAGETIATISSKVGLSVGAVHGVVNAPTPTAPKTPALPPTSPAPHADRPPPSAEEMRRDLASQVDGLRAELEAAETPAMRASLNRLIVSASALLARITPHDSFVPPPGKMLVDASEYMKLEAKHAEEKLTVDAQAEALLAKVATWPACSACGQHIAPPALEGLPPEPAPPAPIPAPPQRTPESVAPPALEPAVPRQGRRETWRNGSAIVGAAITENPQFPRRRGDGL